MKFLLSLVYVLSFASWALADCNAALSMDVTQKLWAEAIDAEKNLFYSRFASEALVRNALSENQVKISFEPNEAAQEEATYINQEAFAKLVTSLAHIISDVHHFGVKMNIPILVDPTIDLNVMVSQVNDQLPPESILDSASNFVMQLLEAQKEEFPLYFIKAKELLAPKYQALHIAMQNDGMEHRDVYEHKHDYLEINNFAARTAHKFSNGKSNVGFLHVEGSDDTEKLKSIGFVIESENP